MSDPERVTHIEKIYTTYIQENSLMEVGSPYLNAFWAVECLSCNVVGLHVLHGRHVCVVGFESARSRDNVSLCLLHMESAVYVLRGVLR